MKRTLFAALVLFSASALADTTYLHPSGSKLVLHDKPCTSKAGALAGLPADVRAQMKAATATFDGQAFDACWADVGSDVFVVDQIGGSGSLNGSPFKKAHNA